MRVLHILEATSGGTRRHVLDLLPALGARGVSCSLIYSTRRNAGFHRDAAYLRDQNVQTHEIAMGHRWARREDALALRELYCHLKNHHYDVIHCHSSNAGLLGRIANALQRRSTPVVYTPHYIAFGAGLPRAQRRAALYLEKLLAPQTRYFIAVSQHEYSLLRRVLALPATRAGVIYNGIPETEYRRQETGDSKPESSRFPIGCFGRLTAQKNQSILIRALPAVLRAVPQARLMFVGDGEDREALHTLAARLGCDDAVEFCGDVADVMTLYPQCDVVAQPSRWEGCSYAILEAMSVARAVIASTRGGNPELIAGAGVLLPPHDARAWAQEIIGLARNQSRRITLGKTAKERVGQKFRLDTMTQNTLAVYHSVIRQNQS